MEVVWTKTARKSLQKTYQFIITVWDNSFADAFLSELDNRIEQLKNNPELAPKFHDSDIKSWLSINLFLYSIRFIQITSNSCCYGTTGKTLKT